MDDPFSFDFAERAAAAPAERQHTTASPSSPLNSSDSAQEHTSEEQFVEIDDELSFTGVVYAHSIELQQACDLLPSNRKRSSFVHSLIKAMDLLQFEPATNKSDNDKSRARAIPPQECSKDDLELFHTADYIAGLSLDEGDIRGLKRSRKELPVQQRQEIREDCGLEYDCCPFPGVVRYAELVAGATLACASALLEERCSVAVNWDGGRHHAQAHCASGFCYVNDVALGILSLLTKFDKILYVDIDCHAGDGVADAFYNTERVLCISFHCYEPGFFPGNAGSPERLGDGAGTGFNVNVGLKAGLRDEGLAKASTVILDRAFELYKPQAVVCVAGCDGLARDPLGRWNLTPNGIASVLQYLQSKQQPLLVLGGGGYDNAASAICWATALAALLGRTLDDAIPDHAYFEKYAAFGFACSSFHPAVTIQDENQNLNDEIQRVVKQLETFLVTHTNSDEWESSEV